ncbi:membrane protein required for colicin V production [Paraperlucidibaca baekdonensis]|uniref:Membrane protein required for colicin V production n=1 Tax=Paraperlucidibaca baekdonensis TaxID=748120 RepID=A0A3E0H1N1_9GAMM|nr:CvpA family protein [Paraperlucidibaca baekdonensis]REH36671.1 membrane protein required for colicin V production [Paraperlucidibaca baekdonensis]
MHPADIVILVVLALSLIFGFSRGLVREAIALAGWVLAIYLARAYNEPMAAWLAQWVSTPSVRLVMSYGSLFLGTLVVCSLGGHAISMMLRAGGLSLLDRFFGGLFGVLRGVVLCLIALMLMAPFIREDVWFREAQLPRAILKYESLARQLKDKAIATVRSPTASESASQ